MGDQLFGFTARECREMYMGWYFEPRARLGLLYRNAEAIYLVMAQYYCDEASDATDLKIVSSYAPGSTWPNVSRIPENSPARSPQTLVEEASLHSVLSAGGNYVESIDSSIIYAFSSYCSEGTGEYEAPEESYLPYAVAKRDQGADIVIDITKNQPRPNLDDLASISFNKAHGWWSNNEDPPSPPPFSIRILSAPELIGVWKELHALGGGFGCLRHLVRAANAVTRTSIRNTRWELYQVLANLRDLFNYLGISANHGSGPSRNEPILGESFVEKIDKPSLRLYGENSARLREMWKQWYFAPLARYILKNYPDKRSVTASCTRLDAGGDQDRIVFRFEDKRGNNLAKIVSHYDSLRFPADCPHYSAHYTTLIAFASYCKEAEYLPCAKAEFLQPQRDTSPDVWYPWFVKTQIIGKCLSPEFEDQWRIGPLASCRMVERDTPVPEKVKIAMEKLNAPDRWEFFELFLKCCAEAVTDDSTHKQQELGRYLHAVKGILEDLGFGPIYAY